MLAEAGDLRQRGDQALADPQLRQAVRFTVERLRNAKGQSTEAFGDWEQWREEGRAIRAHTIAHLDHYLARFSEEARARGTEVHFARDAEEARAQLAEIVRASGARRIVKSKSMVSEELGVNAALERAGVEVVETDLGEWIVQLAGETPSHLILPAIHKRRPQIQQLFEGESGTRLSPDTSTLAGHARRRLREKFAQADLGITGCNFAIAETGSVALFTNEGNGRLVTTLPRTHVVLMGMERILPSLADLAVMAELLPRSATGQKLTTYMNLVTGPRRPGEADGPEKLHVIVVDNGRSRQLGDPEFQEVLNCIRCGACLNVCPVYRHIGGHAYGSVYSGPIGAVLTPLLEPSAQTAELAQASTLCGACFEACPVKIPLHDLLVRLRRRHVREGLAPRGAESLGFAAFGWLGARPRLWSWAAGVARRLDGLLRGLPWSWLGRLAPGWTSSRTLPRLPRRSFSELWQQRRSSREGSE